MNDKKRVIQCGSVWSDKEDLVFNTTSRGLRCNLLRHYALGFRVVRSVHGKKQLERWREEAEEGLFNE